MVRTSVGPIVDAAACPSPARRRAGTVAADGIRAGRATGCPSGEKTVAVIGRRGPDGGSKPAIGRMPVCTSSRRGRRPSVAIRGLIRDPACRPARGRAVASASIGDRPDAWPSTLAAIGRRRRIAKMPRTVSSGRRPERAISVAVGRRCHDATWPSRRRSSVCERRAVDVDDRQDRRGRAVMRPGRRCRRTTSRPVRDWRRSAARTSLPSAFGDHERRLSRRASASGRRDRAGTANLVPSRENDRRRSRTRSRRSTIASSCPSPDRARRCRRRVRVRRSRRCAARPNGGGQSAATPSRRPERHAPRATMSSERPRASQASLGDRREAKRRLHGEPPFEARPPRPLAGRRSSAARTSARWSGTWCSASSWSQSETVRSKRVVGRHAGRPSVTSGRGRASASSAARMTWSARCRRDFAVPSGIPSVAATSGNGRSR